MSNASKGSEAKADPANYDATTRKSKLIPRLEALEGNYFIGQDRDESNGPQLSLSRDKNSKPAVADMRRAEGKRPTRYNSRKAEGLNKQDSSFMETRGTRKRATKLHEKELSGRLGDDSDRYSADLDDEQLRGQMFSKGQTSMLQKWFIDNIEHPYVKKTDKKILAQKTGLSVKQITGWFTNNRKRKYQRVVEIAKKRGRGLDYVKEVMIMKFDKDLDKSLSGGSSTQEAKRLRRDAAGVGSDPSQRQSASDRTSKQGEAAASAQSSKTSKPTQEHAPIPIDDMHRMNRDKLARLLSSNQQQDQVTQALTAPDHPQHDIVKSLVKMLDKDISAGFSTTAFAGGPTQQSREHAASGQVQEGSLSGNGSGSQPSGSSRLSKVTFIPIIFTVNAPEADRKFDRALLANVKPILPVQTQIQNALQFISTDDKKQTAPPDSGNIQTADQNREFDGNRSTTPPPRVVNDQTGQKYSNLSGDTLDDKREVSLLRTTATRGLSSSRRNFEASKQISDGRRTNDYLHESAAHALAGDIRPDQGINFGRTKPANAKEARDAALLTRIEHLVNHQLQMLAQPGAATGGSPDGDGRQERVKGCGHQSAASHDTERAVFKNSHYAQKAAGKYSAVQRPEGQLRQSVVSPRQKKTSSESGELAWQRPERPSGQYNLSSLDPSKAPAPTFELQPAQAVLANQNAQWTARPNAGTANLARQAHAPYPANAQDHAMQPADQGRREAEQAQQQLPTGPNIGHGAHHVLDLVRQLLNGMQDHTAPPEQSHFQSPVSAEILQAQRREQYHRGRQSQDKFLADITRQTSQPQAATAQRQREQEPPSNAHFPRQNNNRGLHSERQPHKSSSNTTQSLVKSAAPLGPKSLSNFNQPGQLGTDSIQACGRSNSNDLQNALGLGHFPRPIQNYAYPSSTSQMAQPFAGASGSKMDLQAPAADPDSNGDGSNGSHGMNLNSGSGSGPPLPGMGPGNVNGTNGSSFPNKTTSNQLSGGQQEGSGPSSFETNAQKQQAIRHEQMQKQQSLPMARPANQPDQLQRQASAHLLEAIQNQVAPQQPIVTQTIQAPPVIQQAQATQPQSNEAIDAEPLQAGQVVMLLERILQDMRPRNPTQNDVKNQQPVHQPVLNHERQNGIQLIQHLSKLEILLNQAHSVQEDKGEARLAVAADGQQQPDQLLPYQAQVRPTSAPHSGNESQKAFHQLSKFKLMNFVETTTFGNKSACPSSQQSQRQAPPSTSLPGFARMPKLTTDDAGVALLNQHHAPPSEGTPPGRKEKHLGIRISGTPPILREGSK